MNTDQYSLSDSYVSVGGSGGGSLVPKAVDDLAKKLVQQHYLFSFAIIMVLVIVIIWLAVWKCAEKFNPTSTIRMQQRDGLGENAEGGPDRGKSVFAQQVQGDGGAFVIDPTAKANQPGSLAWQVLHSKDFDCDKRKSAGDDAWSWMQGIAKEGAQGGLSDNDFSRIVAGH